MTKFTASFGHPAWVRQREFGQRFPLGHSDFFWNGLYSSIHKVDNSSNMDHGAVISVDFSPDGSILVAGCVSNYFMIYDPLRRRQVQALNNSERGSLNTVKFLDTWTLASGNEDRSVTLWDIRSLKTWVARLCGHSSPVRHIEFSSKNDVLVTTGEDGKIIVWDFSNMIGGDLHSKCSKFGSDDFWGIRLNQDASKMIISSTEGFLTIVHDLDLNTVAEDLAGFYPNIGPSWESEQSSSVPRVNVFSLTRKRNRAEAVMDFPHLDVFNVVSAMEIHPQGWSVLSLCMSAELGMERVSVHDIRDRELPLVGTALPRGSRNDLSSSASRGMCSKKQVDEMDIPRLTHYVEKHIDISENFILKELSFSPDGRLMCCPSGKDIKLHTFSPFCSEQFISWPGREPIPLHEIATFNCDTYVHSTSFSPRHCLLVSGSEDQSINWFQPLL